MELTNELYRKYEKMVNKQVWAVHTKCPIIPLEDLRGAANLIFCEAARSFDESKNCKFSTHLTWKLKSLFAEPDKIRAPKAFEGDSENFWQDLELETEQKNGTAIQMNYKAQTACSDYTAKMNDRWDGIDWRNCIDGFEPYFKVLSLDARQIYNDLLEGLLDPSEKIKKALGDGAKWMEACSNLDAHKMYLRRYKRLGWSQSRVNDARAALASALKQWLGGKLPSTLTKQFVHKIEFLF